MSNALQHRSLRWVGLFLVSCSLTSCIIPTELFEPDFTRKYQAIVDIQEVPDDGTLNDPGLYEFTYKSFRTESRGLRFEIMKGREKLIESIGDTNFTLVSEDISREDPVGRQDTESIESVELDVKLLALPYSKIMSEDREIRARSKLTGLEVKESVAYHEEMMRWRWLLGEGALQLTAFPLVQGVVREKKEVEEGGRTKTTLSFRTNLQGQGISLSKEIGLSRNYNAKVSLLINYAYVAMEGSREEFRFEQSVMTTDGCVFYKQYFLSLCFTLIGFAKTSFHGEQYSRVFSGLGPGMFDLMLRGERFGLKVRIANQDDYSAYQIDHYSLGIMYEHPF